MRWHYQAGNIAIPGSADESEIAENNRIFDFELTADGMFGTNAGQSVNEDYCKSGGYYSIDAEMAVKICESTRPKNITPMYYRTATSGYPELATVDEFVKLAENKGMSDWLMVV